MTDRPTAPGSSRAVDLSSVQELTTPTAATGGGGPRPAAAPGAGRPLPQGLVVEATDATIQDAINRSLGVPAVLVLWSSQHPQSVDFVRVVAEVAAGFGGRLFVVSADLATNPGLLQAFQPLLTEAFGQPAVPATFALLQGQPVPLFPGLAGEPEIRGVLDQLLELALKNGISGRVDLVPVEGADEADELSPLHQEAYDAIERGDLAAAATAYETALAANPKDTDADLGLAQVRLMQRTEGVDAQTARAAAAADPTDVDAAIMVADLDLLGGHVEDAFARLLDLVRTTAGDDRDRVRTHLIGLFAVIGNADERVKKGRTALMSALF
jgi:putative thioredoxin